MERFPLAGAVAGVEPFRTTRWPDLIREHVRVGSLILLQDLPSAVHDCVILHPCSYSTQPVLPPDLVLGGNQCYLLVRR